MIKVDSDFFVGGFRAPPFVTGIDECLPALVRVEVELSVAGYALHRFEIPPAPPIGGSSQEFALSFETVMTFTVITVVVSSVAITGIRNFLCIDISPHSLLYGGRATFPATPGIF